MDRDGEDNIALPFTGNLWRIFAGLDGAVAAVFEGRLCRLLLPRPRLPGGGLCQLPFGAKVRNAFRRSVVFSLSRVC